MIRHYIKTAFRNLLKYKAQNIISIIGLSVGILCFSICLYCSRYINSTDKCFTHWERIADINLYTPAEEPYSGTPATLFESLRQLQFQEVEAFTFVAYPRPRSYNVETIDKEELPYEDLYAMEVDTAYHSVFTPGSITRFMGCSIANSQCRDTDTLSGTQNIWSRRESDRKANDLSTTAFLFT